MPVLSRAVLVGFQAAALVATVGVPLTAYAAPVPVPMPVMHIADYASQPPSRNNATVEPQMDVLSASRRGKDVAVVNHTTSDTSSNERRQDVQDLGSLTSSLGDQSSFLSAHTSHLLVRVSLTIAFRHTLSWIGERRASLKPQQRYPQSSGRSDDVSGYLVRRYYAKRTGELRPQQRT